MNPAPAAVDAERALRILRAHPVSAGTMLIGEVTRAADPLVLLRSSVGAQRIMDMPTREQLPRIC
jgi:hydrogenase expression/formation protein HypE